MPGTAGGENLKKEAKVESAPEAGQEEKKGKRPEWEFRTKR